LIRDLHRANLFTCLELDSHSLEDVAQALVEGGSAKHLTPSMLEKMPDIVKDVAYYIVENVSKDGYIPCQLEGLLDVPYVDECIAHRLLQCSFGCYIAPPLSINCRRVCLAIELLDWEEFRKSDDQGPLDIRVSKISYDKFAKSLLTWFNVSREHWVNFDVALTSLAHLLVEDNRKAKVRSVIKKRFNRANQEELMDMIKAILVYYDLETYS